MKVDKIHVQFKHKLQGYELMSEVPFWRLYMIKVERCTESIQWKDQCTKQRCTRNRILACTPTAITMDELGDLCEMLEPCKDVIFVAYPRKYRLDGRNPANRRSK